MKRIFLPIFCILSAVFFCGCPAELKITPNADNTFSLEYNTVFGEKLMQSLKDLLAAYSQISDNASGEFDLTKIIDAKKVESEMNGTCFNSSQVKIQQNADAYNFKVNTKTKSAEKLPEKFLSQTKTKNGKTRVSLKLNPKILEKALFKNEGEGMLQTFSDIFLAPPLLSGDDMPAEEYRDMLVEVYGEKVAKELLSSELKITLVTPNGKTVFKTVPVLELLTSTTRTFVFEY